MGEKIRILFTGDSITDKNRTMMLETLKGWQAQDLVSTPEEKEAARDELLGCGYPLLVASALYYEEPGRYEVLNRGISGNRIVDLDARVKKDCINLKPDVLSIMIGINDVWHEVAEQNGVDAAKFERVYDSMLSEIRTALPHTRLILLEPYVMKGRATEQAYMTFRTETDLRREAVRRLAAKYGTERIDTQALFDAAAQRGCVTDFTADGVHPAPAGHWMLAQEWLKVFRGQ